MAEERGQAVESADYDADVLHRSTDTRAR